jgi:hypothetical protein
MTEEKVRWVLRMWALRQEYSKYTKTYLAKVCEVDRALIGKIIARTAWKHVEVEDVEGITQGQ